MSPKRLEAPSRRLKAMRVTGYDICHSRMVAFGSKVVRLIIIVAHIYCFYSAYIL